MSAQTIQAIIGAALTDSTFRTALLNGSRRRVLQSFQLNRDEFEAIMAIRSDSLEGFAHELHEFLVKSEAIHEVDPLPSLHVRLVQNLARPPISQRAPAD